MLCALALVSSTAFAPAGMHRSIVSPRAAVDMSAEPMSRRQAMGFAAAAALGVAPAFADDEVAVAPPPPPAPAKPVPVLLPESEYKLKKDYPTDARAMLKLRAFSRISAAFGLANKKPRRQLPLSPRFFFASDGRLTTPIHRLPSELYQI